MTFAFSLSIGQMCCMLKLYAAVYLFVFHHLWRSDIIHSFPARLPLSYCKILHWTLQMLTCMLGQAVLAWMLPRDLFPSTVFRAAGCIYLPLAHSHTRSSGAIWVTVGTNLAEEKCFYTGWNAFLNCFSTLELAWSICTAHLETSAKTLVYG